MSTTSAGPQLVGRELELARVERLVRDAAGGEGGALVVRGEPGIGKSALLAEAGALAARMGMRVLSTSGVQSEAQLPYAGLHQLLRPLLAGRPGLAPQHREALAAAFGIGGADSSEPFLAALAALETVTEAAADAPLLVLVEDVHWLDRPTLEVVSFVARRVHTDPVAVLVASRDGEGVAGLPELRLHPLDPASAAALLDARAPDLPRAARQRFLEDAAGNPLALVELPIGYADLGERAALPRWLPLTTRLEQAFATRIAGLPVATRTALLVAAVDDAGVVEEVLRATASLIDDPGAGIELLEPAFAEGLLALDAAGEVRFRHPLMRSAVHQLAGLAQRHAAHAALAELLGGQPERRVWHRAAAATSPSEPLARELEEAAAGARRRGATGVAATALTRAAQLSTDPVAEGRRLIGAAQLSQELGSKDALVDLLDRAERLELAPTDRARLAWLREELDPGAWSGDARVHAFVGIAEEFQRLGEPELALERLETVALRMWWSNPDQATRDRVVAAAERLRVPPDTPALIAVLAFADPVRRGAPVIERIARLRSDAGGDPAGRHLIGAAATGVWAHDLAQGFLAAAVDGLRAQGRLGLLAQALVSQAWTAVHVGNGALAETAADEAFRLATESGQPRWAMAAQTALGTVAGERGDQAEAERLIDGAEAVLMAAGANPMLSIVQFARGRGAVAHGRHEEGLSQLCRVFDPDDIAYLPHVGAWALGDLIDAAVHAGRRDLASVHLAELERLVAATSSPLLRAQLAYARPLMAGDEDAEALFEAADLAHWPCFRARLLLAYGRWLRRQRRAADSRVPLRAAREAFDALGFRALADTARQELRASGETSRRRVADARDELTPQELQIARMAASGMGNKEIGRQLYLSHRTVASHLYRIFPKLGIASRSELRDALLRAGVR